MREDVILGFHAGIFFYKLSIGLAIANFTHDGLEI
jgi:hypothetical protein